MWVPAPTAPRSSEPVLSGREADSPVAPGHPSKPLTAEALRDKFEECARLALPEDRVDSVRQMVESLETCPDLRSLTAILGP